MNETPHNVRHDPWGIAGYTYGTDATAVSPLTTDDVKELRATVGLTDDDEQYLRDAAEILAPQADDMVTAWRDRIGEHPFLARYSAHPGGATNPEYAAASKPRFDRWIIDACLRPHDRAWLDYQYEIGLRHTRAKKNHTDDADSLEHIPMRFLLAFTAYVLTTSRDFLAHCDHSREHVDRMHAAFTKSVMLHVTVWTQAYVPDDQW